MQCINLDPLNNPYGNRRYMPLNIDSGTSSFTPHSPVYFRYFNPITMQWSKGLPDRGYAYKISRALLHMKNQKNHNSLRTTRFLASLRTK